MFTCHEGGLSGRATLAIQFLQVLNYSKRPRLGEFDPGDTEEDLDNKQLETRDAALGLLKEFFEERPKPDDERPRGIDAFSFYQGLIQTQKTQTDAQTGNQQSGEQNP